MKALAALPLLALATGQVSRTFEPLGVCAVDDRAVSCWGLQGQPDPSLSADVERRVRALETPLGFRLGKKNRFLIARRGPVATTSYQTGAEGMQVYELTQSETPALTMIRYVARPDQRSGQLSIEVGSVQGAPVEMPCREGAKVRVEDVQVEIGEIVENDGLDRRWNFGGPRGYFPNGRWRFSVGRTETTPPGTLIFEPIGKDGKPIRFVDPFGKPVATAKGEALIKEAYGPKRDWTRLPPVDYAQIVVPPANGAFWVSCNVDPSTIAKFKVSRVVTHRETLGPFPLDPD